MSDAKVLTRYYVTHCEWHSDLKTSEADDGRDVEVVLATDYDSLRSQRDALVEALSTLIREATAVANDHHRPRYARLDEALESVMQALAAQGTSGNPHE